MPGEFCKNHDVVWYMMESQSRVVAKSGIPSDRFHLGKLVLQGLRDAPDYVMQIDAVSGEEITFGEILEWSVRCASAFQNIGLRQGDVVLLIASNNLNISVPYYAALYTGLAVSGLDWTFRVRELQNAFENLKPKLIFCLNDKVQDIQLALEKSSPFCKIVSFDESQTVISFDDFLRKHGNLNSIEDFRATELDPEKTIGVIIPTSGTTGTPKGAAVSHKALFFHGIVIWTYGKQFPEPKRLALVSSPLQWLSAHVMFVGSPLLRFTRLMYTQPSTPELLTEIIKKYRPTFSIFSPPMLAMITGEEKCDATCFEQLVVGGSAVHKDLIIKFKSKSPNTHVLSAFGATEFGVSYITELPDSLGQPLGFVRTRLVGPETQEDVNEPHRRGELWTKGHSMFLGYYNNPTETKNAFSEDGWFKTGDLFYKDEYGNIHFVERLKLLLTYKDYQIFPVEIESVILKNPGVNDVCVVGIPDLEHGELAVAFVVKKDGATVTAQDIKNVVQQNLAETKHLHGGVIFIDKLPLTVSTKVHRQKLKEMAKTMVRE